MADEPAAQPDKGADESPLVQQPQPPLAEVPKPPVIITPQGTPGGDPAAVTFTRDNYYEVSTEVSSSPFPPPALLKQYKEQLGPETVERIMAMVEKEGDHRRALEVKQVDADIVDVCAQRSEQCLGQWLGFGIGIFALAAGGTVAIFAPTITGSVAGSIIGGSGVAGLVAVFVLGRRQQASKDAKADEAE